MKYRNVLIGGSAALMLVVIALGSHIFKTKSVPEAASPKAVLTVAVTSAQQQRWPVVVKANGTIVAWQEAIIGAETGGLRISALYADIGQRVKRGQLLAELARATVEADLRRYQAALASARASYGQAKANAARARMVKGSGAISEQQVAEYLATEQTALASVEEAAAQVASQQVTLTQTRIIAVDDGIISAKSAVLGQVVTAGTELFRLQRQGRLEWQAEVAARQLGMIQPGAKATVLLPTGKALEGKVRLVSPTLSTSTSRANVLVSLPVGAREGMFANGQIEAGSKTVQAVPEAALVLRDGLSYLFEIGEDHKVIRRRVESGDRRDGLVEIRSGMTPGARIAASGGAFLADGDIVSLSGEAK